MNFMAQALRSADADCEQPLTLDAVHILRSRIIDKCAEAERQVFRLIRERGSRINPKAPLSQKLEALKLLADSEPGRRWKNIRRFLRDLQPLSDTRSELTHSTLSLSLVEGTEVVVLQSATEPERAHGRRAILTQAELLDVHRRLSRIANSLKQLADACPAEAGFPPSRE